MNNKITFSLVAFCFMLCAMMTSCKDDGYQFTDPIADASASTITDFSPKEGEIAGILNITGQNITSDISRIKVFVGPNEAKVKTCDGSTIVCALPTTKNYFADVKVFIYGQDGTEQLSYTFPTQFKYTALAATPIMVETLCGVGITPADGSFSQASFGSPCCVRIDPTNPNIIYMVEDNYNGGICNLRRIDIAQQKVETLIQKSDAKWERVRNLFFNSKGDTLFITNLYTNRNADYRTRSSVEYALRSEDFRKTHMTTIDQEKFDSRADCATTHPVDGTLFFFSRYYGGSMYQITRSDNGGFNPSKMLWCLDSGNAEANLQTTDLVFHPSGDYAYLIVWQQHCIYKMTYDKATHALSEPVLFAGEYGKSGNDAGHLNNPQGGCFAKDETLVGIRDDIYDFYFCDGGNNKIRKITPDGTVSSYCGTGAGGNIDGEGLTEATFKNPYGICYDEINKRFYVADHTNQSDQVARSIRVIKLGD